MKKYIIWTPSLKLNSGGVTLLHRLTHMINNLGHSAFMWPGDNNFQVFMTNAKYNISLANKEMINDDAIVVYPEIAIGNPLNAKNVVRWILNKPGKLGGDGIYGKKDIIFYLSDAFTDGKKGINYLKIMELYGDMFVDRGIKRKGSCFVMRKGKGREIVHDLSDSIEIVESTPSEYLVQLFNEKKYFYCYDDASFMSLQAALCGCISIVIPQKDITAEEWLGYSKTRKYGIAYGEENIEHAVTTKGKVRPLLESLEAEFYENVKNFISKTQFWADNKTVRTQSKNDPALEFETSEIKISEAEKLIESGKLMEAKKIITDLLNEDSSNIRVLNDLSIIEIIDKNFVEARNIVEKILEVDDSNELAIDNYEYLSELVN